MAHNVTAGDEKTLRGNLKTFLEAIAILGNVHTRRRRVDNRADFVTKFGVQIAAVPLNQIVRYVDIEFVRFEDSPSEGFDDCPVLIATYNLHLFQEFFEVDDDANSNDDAIESLLTLRDKFLETQEFPAGNFDAESEPLTMPEFMSLGNDGFTDAVGHFADLQLRVNFYDD